MGKKIAIIGTMGLPAKYGGFETLAEYLTKYLSREYNFTVYCSGKSYQRKKCEHNSSRLVYLPLKANGIQSIPYDIISIIKALRYADGLLILGVSGCIILPIVKKISDTKVVVNVDGIEWERKKWNKVAKWFLRLSEKYAVRYADVVVTDNKVIQDYVRDEYAVAAELIGYGGNHVEKIGLSKEILDQYPFLKKPYAFSVCRIEPENNLDIIIGAMMRQEILSLVIIGNWESSRYSKCLRAKFNGYKNIHLLDPIYEQSKLNQIRSNCYVYIHGHSAGGTNPSLVEAMMLGLPIFAYGADYNRETTEQGASYFYNTEDLADLVTQIDDGSLLPIGKKMKEIANSRYQWEKISEQYSRIFR